MLLNIIVPRFIVFDLISFFTYKHPNKSFYVNIFLKDNY